MRDTGYTYLLKVDNLKTYFPIRKGLLRRTAGYVKAVDGVSFGIEIFSAEKVELRRIRSQISLIFQDPYGSLNPRMTIGNIVGEPLKVQRKIADSDSHPRTGSRASLRVNDMERVADLLSKVGLSPDYMNRYPHEFSGGQRQRIGIARALVLGPKLVICDEPVSALDVSIQSQILNLLKDLQEEFGLTFLFIAHDLAVVEFFCDIVAVMYMGRIVEQATAQGLYRNPLHPYTRALISAVPGIEQSLQARRATLVGEVPSALNRFPQGGFPPGGCPFHPRCTLRRNDCSKQIPALKRGKGTCEEHLVACWEC
jgi:oligopeptide/dipeptide ABC transporter ATP-binding protein